VTISEPEIASTPAALDAVFVIDVNDRFAHLFTSVADLLTTHESAVIEAPRGLDFFDRDGYRLAPAFDDTWRLVGLVRTGEKPDPETVQGRLAAVFAYLAQYTREHAQEIADDYGLSVDEALGELPDLAGKSLAESIAALGGVTHPGPTADSDQHDSGNWFHNLMHNL
jgi:hypothetical protein